MALSFPMSSSSSPARLGAGSIANRWRELQGSGSWDRLLDPLDSDLRSSVIAYGELAEAAYDVFNANVESPEAGQCMYSCTGLLAASGVSHPEYYTVTKFLYATCDFRPWSTESCSSVNKALFVLPVTVTKKEEEEEEEEEKGSVWTHTNWIGYVAVATDKGVEALGRRDIVVVWRGTVKRSEMFKDGDFRFLSAAPVLGPSANFNNAKVHHGFLSVYTAEPRLEIEIERNHQVCSQTTTTDISLIQTSARDQALQEVRRLMEAHKDEVTSITVTGHSLGASLATLNAVDIVAHHVNVNALPCPVTAILFASPRTGNDEFKRAFASFPELRALGVINKNDQVPNLPPARMGYVDATTATLPIDTTRSPYLRPGDMFTYHYHNLEVYLHGVAGDQGDCRDFELVVYRDVVLVNKRTNALKERYPVPAEWWATNYKGNHKGVVGRWKLDYFKDE